ncbi:hypothetical protein F4805DRAFT_463705 [Annulohypoxylon moriforme]|nr:hypothetical protein F4805DRAFT_463705 [Annulohypoxylon moriforme]
MAFGEKEKKFGVWTTFLDQLIGIGLKVGHKRASSIHDLYRFERIETKEAYPTKEYVGRMVKTEAVKKYLERFEFKKPVYLVVGVKVVSGTTVKQILKKDDRGG